MAVVSDEFSDFSGGMVPAEEPDAFENNQWAQLEGMVLESESRVRSQWALQRIGQDEDWEWVQPFDGRVNSYIVAQKKDGSIWYAEAPSGNATHGTVSQQTFTALTGVSGLEGIQGDVHYRPLGEVLLPTDATPLNGQRSGFLIGIRHVSDKGQIVVYENAIGTGMNAIQLPNHLIGDPLIVEDEDGNPTGTVEYETGAMPKASVARMWGDTLVLGDIRWKADPSKPLETGNIMRRPNAIWISRPGDVTSWDPTGDSGTGIWFVVSPGAAVVDMVEIDIGLVVLTSVSDRNYDGLLLLRGDPSNFVVEPIRAGLGGDSYLVRETWNSYDPDTMDGWGAGKVMTLWPEVGTAVFTSAEGGLWQTTGAGVERLDHYGPPRLIEQAGSDVINFNTVTGQPDQGPPGGPWEWTLASWGSFLLWARQDGLWCLRAFQEDGAWTKLLTDDEGTPVRYLAPLRNQLYFIQGRKMYRYTMERDEERGLIDGQRTDLTLSTATLARGWHAKTHWHRVGVRARSATSTGRVERVNVCDGPALAANTNKLEWELDEEVSERHEILVRAHGPTMEMSAQVVVTGDVQAEGVTVYRHEGRMSR